MSHQPFEDWLFSDEQLNNQQKENMQAHLMQCEQCQSVANALNHVNTTFKNSSNPEPSQGFTQRWFEKLSITREQQKIKRTWIIILGFFSTATIISVAITAINLNSINWAYQLSQFIASFSLFAGKINQIWRLGQRIANGFPLIIPIMIVLSLGLFSFVSALFVASISSIIRIYKPLEEGVY